MRTAIDSSVLLDVLGADPSFGERSLAALRRAYDAGALVACDVVWAEVRAHFASGGEFELTLTRLGVRFDPLTAVAAASAGRLWRDARRGGTPKSNRVIADFLIGAHAAEQADALLTRDRGFYRQHFRRLKVVDPSED